MRISGPGQFLRNEGQSVISPCRCPNKCNHIDGHGVNAIAIAIANNNTQELPTIISHAANAIIEHQGAAEQTEVCNPWGTREDLATAASPLQVDVGGEI